MSGNVRNEGVLADMFTNVYHKGDKCKVLKVLFRDVRTECRHVMLVCEL